MKASDLIGVWVLVRSRARQAIAFNLDSAAVISHTPAMGIENQANATWQWTDSGLVVVRREREGHPAHELRFDVLDDDTIAIRKGTADIVFKRQRTA